MRAEREEPVERDLEVILGDYLVTETGALLRKMVWIIYVSGQSLGYLLPKTPSS